MAGGFSCLSVRYLLLLISQLHTSSTSIPCFAGGVRGSLQCTRINVSRYLEVTDQDRKDHYPVQRLCCPFFLLRTCFFSCSFPGLNDVHSVPLHMEHPSPGAAVRRSRMHVDPTKKQSPKSQNRDRWMPF